jgi:hypothetical protein
MTTKTYTNKSNAARAAKAANGGTLEGLTLMGQEGAWYYDGKLAGADATTQAASAPHVAAEATEQAATAPEAAAPVANTPEAAKKGAHKPLAKRAPKAPAKAAPTSKEVAAAYPKGVQALKVNETKGKNKPRMTTGYKLQKDRDEAHGVKRKSTGTVGDQLWAVYDKLLAQLKAKNKKAGAKDLALAHVRDAGIKAGFNATTVALAFYQWRRFHGVRGRGRKQKVDGE